MYQLMKWVLNKGSCLKINKIDVPTYEMGLK